MWVTCYHCDGSGYNNEEQTSVFHLGTDVPSNICITCYTPFFWEDDDTRGKIWVYDNDIPITPPSSPRS